MGKQESKIHVCAWALAVGSGIYNYTMFFCNGKCRKQNLLVSASASVLAHARTTGSSVCIDCEAGKYVNVTSGTTCLECRKDPCPFPGTFELSICTSKTNKVCEVYVHNVPRTAKIAIACGQSPLVFLTCYFLFKFSKLRSAVQGQDWKWILCIFVVGVNDVISDFSTLSLIPIKNPFFLFWVSLTSLLCSFVFCLVTSFCSQIDLTWPLRVLVFLSGSAADYGQGLVELWNSGVLFCVENVPQLVVQSILLYLQGSVGFDGWDWAILVQSLLFSILNLIIKFRKLRKHLLERMDQGTGVLGAVAPGATAMNVVDSALSVAV